MPEYDQKFTGKDSKGKPLHLGISDGSLVAIGESISGEATSNLDFGEAMILPSWIDSHVHFNEPGRTDWEGIETGSKALAAGGGTVFFDMPLNSNPPVITAEALHEKRALAETKSWTDFAIWGGLTPDSLSEMPAMAKAGAIGFKSFLCPSGIDEFSASHKAILLEGAKIAADLGLPVAVHAEVGEPYRPDLAQTDFAAWCASRPIEMELAGIEMALEAAAKTGAAFHIVHVTSSPAVELIQQAKSEGLNVTLETCPHYLLLNESSGASLGNIAKCAPPLRNADQVTLMWEHLLNDRIDTIGSDHSPCPPDMKTSNDLFQAWGGIAGIQHGLPLLLSKSLDLSEKYSDKVAKRFRLPRKGGFQIGSDADFIVAERGSFPVADDPCLTRYSHSPYREMTASIRIQTTYLRGQAITSAGRGRFLQPTSPS